MSENTIALLKKMGWDDNFEEYHVSDYPAETNELKELGYIYENGETIRLTPKAYSAVAYLCVERNW